MDRSDLKKISLLYVEDDEDIRDELVDFLELYFESLYVAKNGEEGLALFHQNKPDIVVSDIQMPLMDGLTMCEEIRKVNTDVPLIITTAFNEPSFLIKSIDLGVDRYVTKPINITKLEKSLMRCGEFVLQKRKIDSLLKLSYQLMDKNDNLMYMTGKEFQHINKSLLNFLGFNTVEEFSKNHKTIFENLLTLSKEQISTTKTQWIEFIKNNREKEHIIYFKGCDSENNENIIPYKVNINYYAEMEHYLIIFDELEENY